MEWSAIIRKEREGTNKMKKYIISANSISHYELEVMANSEEEAMDKADQIDGSEWTEVVGEGDWNPISAEEVKE
jgi:hypothetical protein